MDSHEEVEEIIQRLPIESFSLSDDSIRTSYVNELKTITEPEALREFVKKWLMLWTTPYYGKYTSDFEKSLLDDSFDAEEALRCITKNRKGVCEHITDEEIGCVAPDIFIPGLLALCSIISREFEVPFNTAFHQVLLTSLKESRSNKMKILDAGRTRDATEEEERQIEKQQSLISDACRAEELIDLDELERFAEEMRLAVFTRKGSINR